MDLIVYCGILLMLGVVRVNKTSSVPDSVGVAGNVGTTTADCELPIGQNLELIKEPEAYTIILKEFGLM